MMGMLGDQKVGLKQAGRTSAAFSRYQPKLTIYQPLRINDPHDDVGIVAALNIDNRSAAI
jgi:hypothetical protein